MTLFKNKKFTFLHLLLVAFLISLITFFITDFWKSKQLSESNNTNSSPICRYDVKRLSGLKYIKPIMFVDEECESDNLVSIKKTVNDIIERYKAQGYATSASVYLREYTNSEWMSVNDTEKYEPGSLFKVPVLITILKMNEDNPGFINKVIPYRRPFIIDKNVAYSSKSIKVGQSYTVKELLTYMIKYSDNNATALLESIMNLQVLQKLFSDIGLEIPSQYAKQYFFTVREYSLFMRAIYNAGYLTINDSEYAAELLTECDFKDGIVKGIPNEVMLAHKFGESGNASEKQLHESAIVYLNGMPYLLTVMTKGKDNAKLAQLIAEISQSVYANMLASI